MVIDASVVVKALVLEEYSEQASELFFAADVVLWAPAHMLAEAAEVLERKRRDGKITEDQFSEAVASLPGAAVSISLDLLISDAVALARTLNHSVYDCLYLAAARRRQVPLITADGKFRDKARRAGHDTV